MSCCGAHWGRSRSGALLSTVPVGADTFSTTRNFGMPTACGGYVWTRARGGWCTRPTGSGCGPRPGTPALVAGGATRTTRRRRDHLAADHNSPAQREPARYRGPDWPALARTCRTYARSWARTADSTSGSGTRCGTRRISYNEMARMVSRATADAAIPRLDKFPASLPCAPPPGSASPISTPYISDQRSLGQVDFVGPSVNGERDGARCRRAVKVVDERYGRLPCHLAFPSRQEGSRVSADCQDRNGNVQRRSQENTQKLPAITPECQRNQPRSV
jgi:hypothetical protein